MQIKNLLAQLMKIKLINCMLNSMMPKTMCKIYKYMNSVQRTEIKQINKIKELIKINKILNYNRKIIKKQLIKIK